MKYVYIISPVASDPDFENKRGIITSVSRSLGVQPLFPLDRDPGVALERASCYFELGLAEATGVEVGILAKAGTPIHQVGYASQVNFYRTLEEYSRIVTGLLESKFAGASPLSQPTTA
jgi:hypothetical protein